MIRPLLFTLAWVGGCYTAAAGWVWPFWSCMGLLLLAWWLAEREGCSLGGEWRDVREDRGRGLTRTGDTAGYSHGSRPRRWRWA